MKKNISLILVAILLISSCKKDNETTSKLSNPVTYNSKGIFVINEGAYGQGNGSISYFRTDSNYIDQSIYKNVNSLDLGDVVQSMSIYNNNGYIVVNNSQKVEVVNMFDFKRKTTIIGLASPRYFLGINSGKGYISDWTDNNIKIIDLSTNQITGTIPCGAGPDQMLLLNNKVYVCNVGGFGNDSTLTVIDATTNSVLNTLPVGLNPNSIQIDANGKIWVLSGGSLGPDYTAGTSDDIGGKLLQIDPSNGNVLKQFLFLQGDHPVKMAMNSSKNNIYFLGGNSTYTGTVFRMNILETSLPSVALINREFYGIGIDPSNENIYCGIGNFSLNSYILHFNSNGTILDSAKVGLGPNGFVFNN